MKKIILPALFGVMLLASCKKDYTCECTNVRTEVGVESGTVVSNSSGSTTLNDVTKKQVKNKLECYSTESKYSGEAYLGYNPVTFESEYEPTTVTSVSTCELKK